MKGKRVKRKGFTLAELLIVVAVIAVLVAVAIPTFANQLEKSRQAVDVATLREAYAAAVVIQMDGYFMDSYATTPKLYYLKETPGQMKLDGPIYYNPKTGEYTKDLDKLKSEGVIPYGKAHSGSVVADVSGLKDLGVNYSPGYLSAKDTGVSATLLSTPRTAEQPETGKGTANGGIAAMFVQDAATKKFVPAIGYVPLVSKDGNSLLADSTIVEKLKTVAGNSNITAPTTPADTRGVEIKFKEDLETSIWSKVTIARNTDGKWKVTFGTTGSKINATDLIEDVTINAIQ